MSKLTPVEAAAHRERELEKFWKASRRAKWDHRFGLERWYRDNVQTGKAACLDITGGQWP